MPSFKQEFFLANIVAMISIVIVVSIFLLFQHLEKPTQKPANVESLRNKQPPCQNITFDNNNGTPPCLVPKPGSNDTIPGAWVCRTLYDVVTGNASTFSACIDSCHLIENDTVGCCGGICPPTDPCNCECDIDETLGDNINDGNVMPRDGDWGDHGGGDHGGGDHGAGDHGRGDQSWQPPPPTNNSGWGDQGWQPPPPTNNSGWGDKGWQPPTNNSGWLEQSRHQRPTGDVLGWGDQGWQPPQGDNSSWGDQGWQPPPHGDNFGEGDQGWQPQPPPPPMDDSLMNQTGILVQLIGSNATRCVSRDISAAMINGPGFFGRYECVTICPNASSNR